MTYTQQKQMQQYVHVCKGQKQCCHFKNVLQNAISMEILEIPNQFNNLPLGGISGRSGVCGHDRHGASGPAP